MSLVPLRLSFPFIYFARHEKQYGCCPGHGRRRPNGRFPEEFAVMAAETGEFMTWNGPKQISHVGQGLDMEYSERGIGQASGGGENGRRSTWKGFILFLGFAPTLRQYS